MQFLSPIDPLGGGTWLSTNTFGLSLALLNYYQGRMPKGKLRSRGHIVKALAACRTQEDVVQALEAFPLAKYAPFSLLLFADLKQARGAPLLRWSGRELTISEHCSPLISSAKYYDEVYSARLQVYQSIIGGSAAYTPEQFYSLHKNHGGGSGDAKSICMHRADAATVSLSHIHVDLQQRQTRFRYWDGAPCSVTGVSDYQLALL